MIEYLPLLIIVFALASHHILIGYFNKKNPEFDL